ncbi:MAG: arginine--tRNA ligase, partial [bacterium]
ANPTGPINIVSGRAAAVGDALVNLLNAVGYDAIREYYVNDAGRQIRLLGESVSARYMELLGKEETFPEEGYHGEYIRDLANEIISEYGEKFASVEHHQRCAEFSTLALEKLLSSQRKVLADFRVDFDLWFRESKLRLSNAHTEVFDALSEKGYVYEKEGAQWFKSSRFGDEKDRVLITREGEPTYFLVDIAYHVDKYKRGFEQLYDLWGPDHHGYINRVKAALVAMGYPKGSFEVNIIQQVNLLEGGEVIKMSKRAGKIIEMKELIDEVGVDVARFFFVARRSQSQLDFDMDLAKNTSEENPVYYVQYAHARICNIMRHAEEQGYTLPDRADLTVLTTEEESTLIKKLSQFPDVVSQAAKFLEPHRIPNYLKELAADFHRFYHHHRVVTENKALTEARLILIQCARIVLANGFRLLGISAPERM